MQTDKNNKKVKKSKLNKLFDKTKMIYSATAIILTIIVLLTIYSITSILAGNSKEKETITNIEITEATTTQEQSINQRAEQMLNSMSLSEKIYQLFIVTPDDLLEEDSVTLVGNRTKEALINKPIGGLVYFNQNLYNEEQIKDMTRKTKEYMQEMSKPPLFLSIDEEGGTIARLGNKDSLNLPRIENMSQIGTNFNIERAEEVGKIIGNYLSEYGFNLTYAPVADVLTNYSNIVVRYRSFGYDKDIVSVLSYCVSKGLNSKGVLSCYKHFPNHGATLEDSHKGVAVVSKTYEQLMETDFIPFINAIKNDATFIMVGHISVPYVVGDKTPSSLSKKMITEILKGDLGYKGLVITDALNMSAITDSYTADRVAVMALNAGVDVLLMPEDLNIAYAGILDAVGSGKITEERINESVLKILKVKYKYLAS